MSYYLSRELINKKKQEMHITLSAKVKNEDNYKGNVENILATSFVL